MAPTVSVVIPTYNRADLLEAALQSVFAQSFTDYEVIVVDDGSTDDAAERLRRYENRLTVITQENRGVGCARNRGIEAARGRYVALLDNDDVWLPDKLAVQHDFMLRHPEAVGCSVLYSVDPSGRPGFDPSIVAPDGIVGNALEKFAKGHLFLLSSVMMLDVAKVGDLRYEAEKETIEDIALEIRLLLRGPYGIAGDRPLAMYREHRSNASRSARRLFGGIRSLRAIQSGGEFAPCTAQDGRLIDLLISALGRKMLVAQATVGARRRGLTGYISEFPHQLRNRRMRFIFLFPLLLIMPRWILSRFFLPVD